MELRYFTGTDSAVRCILWTAVQGITSCIVCPLSVSTLTRFSGRPARLTGQLPLWRATKWRHLLNSVKPAAVLSLFIAVSTITILLLLLLIIIIVIILMYSTGIASLVLLYISLYYSNI